MAAMKYFINVEDKPPIERNRIKQDCFEKFGYPISRWAYFQSLSSFGFESEDDFMEIYLKWC